MVLRRFLISAGIGAGLALAGFSLVNSPGIGDTMVAFGSEIEDVDAEPALEIMEAELTLERGETLSGLLMRAGLSGEEARALIGIMSSHRDPRRLREGMTMAVRRLGEEGDLHSVHVPIDADSTLVISVDSTGWAHELIEAEVTEQRMVIAGTIESSLYASLMRVAAELPEAERSGLVDILAERIFAWQIDFSKEVREGDHFRIVYDRLVRENGTARSAQVVAAQLDVGGRNLEAYRAATGGYYDRNGGSMKRQFLRAPVEYRRISSGFANRRFHPVLGTYRAHNGVDYAAPTGTPIRAVADGQVVRAGGAGGYGNLVELKHTHGITTRYAHLSRFASGIRAGSQVKQGDIIGYVGATGLATGPHLHYELHQNGRPVNPNSIRHTAGDPLTGDRAREFRARIAKIAEELDALKGESLVTAAQTRPTDARPLETDG
jgi:murein DD-endopeptidase MepM/ murein hydrolase activator NlpD